VRRYKAQAQAHNPDSQAQAPCAPLPFATCHVLHLPLAPHLHFPLPLAMAKHWLGLRASAFGVSSCEEQTAAPHGSRHFIRLVGRAAEEPPPLSITNSSDSKQLKLAQLQLRHCAFGTFFDSSPESKVFGFSKIVFGRFLLLIDVDGASVKHAVRNAPPCDNAKCTYAYWGKGKCGLIRLAFS
jgi:hypothetical protein